MVVAAEVVPGRDAAAADGEAGRIGGVELVLQAGDIGQRTAHTQGSAADDRAAAVGIGGVEREQAGAGLGEVPHAGSGRDHAGIGLGRAVVEDHVAVVDNVAGDRAVGRAVAELQRTGGYRGAARVAIRAREDRGARASLNQATAAADGGAHRIGIAAVDDQAAVVHHRAGAQRTVDTAVADRERTRVDGGRAGVAVVAGEGEGAGACLGQRAADAGDCPRESSAGVVAADGQDPAAEEDRLPTGPGRIVGQRGDANHIIAEVQRRVAGHDHGRAGGQAPGEGGKEGRIVAGVAGAHLIPTAAGAGVAHGVVRNAVVVVGARVGSDAAVALAKAQIERVEAGSQRDACGNVQVPIVVIDDHVAVDREVGAVVEILAKIIGDVAAGGVVDIAAVAPGGVVSPCRIHIGATCVVGSTPSCDRLN